MKKSIFNILSLEGLNRMEIHYDWRRDNFVLYSAMEWDPDTSFRDYNKKFTVTTLRTANGKFFNHTGTEELFAKQGLTPHLDQI